MHHDIAVLTLITLGAYLMPIISRKLMLPSSVAELFYGIVLGTFFLKGQQAPSSVKLVSELGFMLLMYIAGLELDLDRIISLKRKEVAAFLGYGVMLAAGSFIFAGFLNMHGFFILILMTSAIGLLFSLLKELNMVKTYLGQTLILLGVIGEIMTLTGLTVYTLVSREGTAGDKAFQILFICLLYLQFLWS